MSGITRKGWLEWDWDFATSKARWTADDSFALPAETTRDSLIALLHPDDRERLLRELSTAISTGGTMAVDHRLRTPAGVWRWVSSVAVVTLDPRGAPASARGVVVDVHDSHGDIGKLNRLRRLYAVLLAVNRAMVKSAGADALLVDTCRVLVEEGGFRTANALLFARPGERVRLAASANAVACPLTDAVRTRVTSEVQALFGLDAVWFSNGLEGDARLQSLGLAQLAAGSGAAVVPLWRDSEPAGLIILCSPAEHFVQEEVSLLRQLGDDVSFALTTLTHHHVLREQEARYRGVFEQATDGIFLADAGGHYVDANQAGLAMLGFTLAELRAHTVYDLAPAETPPPLAEPALAGTHVRERPLRRKDGSMVLVELSSRSTTDGSIAIARKLEDRRRFEAQLQLTDRLVSLGTLAGGVAHELNNPLSWIISNLTQAREHIDALRGHLEVEQHRELVDLLSESLEGAHRIVNVVSDLRTFTRTDSPKTRVPLDRVLERACKMVAIQARYRGQLVTRYGSTPEVQGSESQLTQVFVNLLLNAVQALPEGRPEGNKVEVVTFTDARDRAVVEVRDTGAGISPHNLQQIFAPFFTTKPVGLGTGLGLTVVFNIVSQLGGTVDVQSEVGVGTTVRVCLPAAEASDLVNPGRSPS